MTRGWPGRLLFTVVALGCAAPAPKPLAIGEDDCGYCRMQITDARFGGEIVTSKGKVDTFDSIECLASYYLAQMDTAGLQLFVSDFAHPGQLIPVSNATFRRGASGTASMGQQWTASETWPGSDAVRWAGVLDQVRSAGVGEDTTLPSLPAIVR